MKTKKAKKRVVYPISLSIELYNLIIRVTEMHVASTRANVMRQALQIGLDTMVAKHE